MAQLALNEKVAGSNPALGSIKQKCTRSQTCGTVIFMTKTMTERYLDAERRFNQWESAHAFVNVALILSVVLLIVVTVVLT